MTSALWTTLGKTHVSSSDRRHLDYLNTTSAYLYISIPHTLQAIHQRTCSQGHWKRWVSSYVKRGFSWWYMVSGAERQYWKSRLPKSMTLWNDFISEVMPTNSSGSTEFQTQDGFSARAPNYQSIHSPSDESSSDLNHHSQAHSFWTDCEPELKFPYLFGDETVNSGSGCDQFRWDRLILAHSDFGKRGSWALSTHPSPMTNGLDGYIGFEGEAKEVAHFILW